MNIEDIKICLIGLAMVSLIILFSVGIPSYLNKNACYAKTEGMGFNVEWSFLGGCRIEYENGKWIPLDRYRIIED